MNNVEFLEHAIVHAYNRGKDQEAIRNWLRAVEYYRAAQLMAKCVDKLRGLFSK